MEALGNQLRSVRENRGLRRVDVSKATKVCAHHLSAIEHGNLDDLPDPAEVEGYIRVVAEYLEMDSEAVVEEFRKEHPAPPAVDAPTEVVVQGDPPAEPAAVIVSATPTDPGRTQPTGARPIRWKPGLAIAAGIVVIALAGWLASRGSETDPATVEPAPAVEAVSPPEPSAATPAAIVPAANDAPAATSGAPAAAPPPESLPTATAPPAVAKTTPEPTETPRTDVRPGRSQSGSRGSGSLSIAEFGVGTGVANHRLVGETDTFPEGSRVWFWTRVAGGAPGEKIVHVWTREGRLMDRIELGVGATTWRTQSRKTLYGTGAWAVEARDGSGNVLARSEFSCKPR